MDCAAVAAKRYRKFKGEQKKESAKKNVILSLFNLFQIIVKMLQEAHILRRQNFERVIVE